MNWLETVIRTFTDGLGKGSEKQLAILPSNGVEGKVVVNDALPKFDGTFCNQEVTRLESSSDHRRILREAFRNAQRMVLIVSPFITRQAVEADRVDELVAAAVRRGVKVVIVVDNELNRDASGNVKQGALWAKGALERAGARVVIARSIHNKTLCVDRKMICEGSFNWLSAVRTRGARHQRMERSIMVCGRKADGMVNDVMRELGLVA